jgi:hypothetical protein
MEEGAGKSRKLQKNLGVFRNSQQAPGGSMKF